MKKTVLTICLLSLLIGVCSCAATGDSNNKGINETSNTISATTAVESETTTSSDDKEVDNENLPAFEIAWIDLPGEAARRVTIQSYEMVGSCFLIYGTDGSSYLVDTSNCTLLNE